MTVVDAGSSTFTTHELTRLSAYRAAVAAGFYTDWDGSATSTDVDALAWLATAGDALGGYPFTPHELAQLERGRTAVEAGYYTDAEVSPPSSA
jgi:hypothetical protein